MGLTLSQVQAQGGTAIPNGSDANSLYQNYVKNNVQGALTPPPTQSGPNIVGDLLHPLTVAGTKIAEAGVGAVTLPQENSEITTQNQNAAKLKALLDQIHQSSDPIQRANLTAQAKQLVAQSIPNQQAEENNANILGKLSNTQNVSIPGTGTTAVPAQQSGLTGVKQIAGQGLEDAAYLYGGQGLGALGEGTGVLANAGRGAVMGAVAGGAAGAGQEMQQPQSGIGDIAKAGAEGAAGGAITGGVIGGGLGAYDKLTAPNEEYGKITPEQARQQAAQQGVKSVSDIKSGTQQGESQLGANFRQAAEKVGQGDSQARLNLTNDQLDKLNALKEGKNFSLPDYLEKGSNTPDNGTGKFGNIKLTPKAQAELEAAGKSTNTSLTPEQSQDLIRKLNQSTYKEVGGSLQVDQQRVDLTKEIKNSAQSAFGHVTDENGDSVWNKAYQDYAKGKQVTEDLKSLTGQKNSSTPPDKVLNKVLDLGKTPEGKIMLQNAVDEFKSQTGIDLTDSTKAIHQILDKQLALEQANQPSGLKTIGKYALRREAVAPLTFGTYAAIRAIVKALGK